MNGFDVHVAYFGKDKVALYDKNGKLFWFSGIRNLASILRRSGLRVEEHSFSPDLVEEALEAPGTLDEFLVENRAAEIKRLESLRDDLGKDIKLIDRDIEQLKAGKSGDAGA